MSLRDTLRAELAARRPDRVLWPRAIENLVIEGLALDAASQRGEPVNRERAADIVRELDAYVNALLPIEQPAASRALVQRFAAEAR
jgi:hypothetical protein